MSCCFRYFSRPPPVFAARGRYRLLYSTRCIGKTVSHLTKDLNIRLYYYIHIINTLLLL